MPATPVKDSIDRNQQEEGQSSGSAKGELKAVWCWIAFILMFFGLQALLWTSALSLAKKHPIRPAPLEGKTVSENTSITDARVTSGRHSS